LSKYSVSTRVSGVGLSACGDTLSGRTPPPGHPHEAFNGIGKVDLHSVVDTYGSYDRPDNDILPFYQDQGVVVGPC
jgi:hypothetical protein